MRKEFKVPIYNSHVILFTDVTVEEMCSEFGAEPVKGYNGAVFEQEDENGIISYVIVLEKTDDLGIIAHECLHVTNYILRNAGVYPDFTNDEPQAYLLMWLVNKVNECLNE